MGGGALRQARRSASSKPFNTGSRMSVTTRPSCPSNVLAMAKDLFSVLRREDSVALISQRQRQDAAEHCVVLSKQHRLLTRLPEIHEIFALGGGTP
jgi:hypothetical protein